MEEAEDCPYCPSLALGPKAPAQAEPLGWSWSRTEQLGWVQPPREQGGQVRWGAWESVVTGTASSHQTD